jgi:hypothetical protein
MASVPTTMWLWNPPITIVRARILPEVSEHLRCRLAFRWLELFNPLMRRTSLPNYNKVRQEARFAAKPDTNRQSLAGLP